ncbi:hypothetical protein FDUTEX481_05171 [Tolypothrix sp. PCC 7601]|nr:hypothetical protein FDUTEX481_05171 [Tolypothrix sp. PCC 7601]
MSFEAFRDPLAKISFKSQKVTKQCQDYWILIHQNKPSSSFPTPHPLHPTPCPKGHNHLLNFAD